VQPARTADDSAVLVVPNVKVRMEAQHSFPPLSLRDLLWESFTLMNQLIFERLMISKHLKSLSLVCIKTKMNPVQTFAFCFFTSHFNTFSSMRMYSKWFSLLLTKTNVLFVFIYLCDAPFRKYLLRPDIFHSDLCL
jgi:hypothetical protein